MTKARQLRELFADDSKIIYVMGAHNGLSAKLVENNKFDAIWASGFEIATSVGVPDADILSMTQYLEKSTELNDAVDIPVISDCDTGYGNSNNVINLVKKYEVAGIAAVCIEDKMFPKVNSFVQGRQELAPIGEFVGKILAAKSTQHSNDFMVIARVEALIAGWGEEEALLRAHKYVEAGADAILIHSKKQNPDEIISFAKKWDKKAPLVIVPTNYPSIMKDYAKEDLLELGIKVVIFANQGIRTAIKAMNKIMGYIRENLETVSIESDIATMQEVFHLQGMSKLKKNEQLYLKSEQNLFNTVFLAAGEPNNQDDLAPLLRDRPIALLDINGKSLIGRNIDSMSQIGTQSIDVVVGYQPRRFNQFENINIIQNEEYNTKKNVLSSFLLALNKISKKTLIAFADILFTKEIVQRLLSVGEDLVLMADPTFRRLNVRNKKLDLIKSNSKPDLAHRHIEGNILKDIVKIGDDINTDDAHYEFIGLSLWNEKNRDVFKKVYNELNQNEKDTTFNQVIQEMINRGSTVKVLETRSGWMEIHTFENYKTACSQLDKI